MLNSLKIRYIKLLQIKLMQYLLPKLALELYAFANKITFFR